MRVILLLYNFKGNPPFFELTLLISHKIHNIQKVENDDDIDKNKEYGQPISASHLFTL